MWPYGNTMAEIELCIKRDIATFSNPGSVAQKDVARPNAFELQWETGRERNHAVFKLDHHRNISVDFKGQKYSYGDFLSCQCMSDLQLLAQRILSTISPVDYFIDPKMRFDDGNTVEIGSLQLVSDLVEIPPFKGSEVIESTRLLFLRAPAGAGKSVAMKMLTRQQADIYLSGAGKYLFFYVDAQGRALARLEEAFALEIQKLVVSGIRYNTVEALTRNRLIIPIIDGFDELIGSGGFVDAFSSMSAFLSSLDRQGTVIATGRSSFYDDKKFSIVAEKYSKNDTLNYHFSKIEVLPWERSDLENFASSSLGAIDPSGDKTRQLLKFYDTANEHNRKLLTKPFFAFQFTNILKEEEFLPSADVDLVEQLIQHLLDREAQKLRSRQGEVVLLPEGHRWLLRELALEMWWQEMRVVDPETLEAIADMAAEKFNLAPEHLNILVERITTHAFLKSSDEQTVTKRAFENEVFYDFFLLDAVMDMLHGDAGEFQAFLSRSLFGESLLDYFKATIKKEPSTTVAGYIESVCKRLNKTRFGALERRNGGALIAAMVRRRQDLPQNLKIANIECYKDDLCGVKLDGVVFNSCFFQDVKFYDSEITNSKLINTTFDRLYMNNNTNFTGTRLIPGENILSVITEDGEVVYNPSSLSNLLTEKGASVPDKRRVTLSPEKEALIMLVDRFASKMRSCLYMDLEEKSDPLYRTILLDPNWGQVQKLLEANDILVRKHMDRSGPRQYLYRLTVDSDTLLAGVSSFGSRRQNKIDEFWHDLLS